MRTLRNLTRLMIGFVLTAVVAATAQAADPGQLYPADSEVSDQKAGSVLIYNLYTSGATSGNTQNTRVTITNTSTTSAAFVHLFFVAENCSIADSFICLTANQTASFLASDVDPGTTGYIVAIANDGVLGCPVSFNFLIGSEHVKLATGHSAKLNAEAFSALFQGLLPGCDANSVTAEIAFNGVAYNRAPRVLAADNIPSRADGNDTLIVINRIGGNLGIGAATLGSIFTLFYDDAETVLSASFTGGCQLRSSLSNNFPRLTPRFETFIPAGRSGWARFFSLTTDIGILGSVLNFNPNTATAGTAYSGGSNMHKLRFATTASYVLPIFPPSC